MLKLFVIGTYFIIAQLVGIASAEEQSILTNAVVLETNVDQAKKVSDNALFDGNFKTYIQSTTSQSDIDGSFVWYIDLGDKYWLTSFFVMDTAYSGSTAWGTMQIYGAKYDNNNYALLSEDFSGTSF